MYLLLIGSWGVRLEDLTQTARRVQRWWELMPQRPDVYTPWGVRHWDDDDVFSIPAVQVDDLDAIARAVTTNTERVNDGPRTAPGFYLEFNRTHPNRPYQDDDRHFQFGARCGFVNPHPMNHLYFHLDPRLETVSARDEDAVVTEHFEAIVRTWQPDHLAVVTHPLLKAQAHKPPQARVGWLTYLRDGIDLDTADIDDILTTRGDGGRYLRLAGTPWQPDMAQVLRVRRALGHPLLTDGGGGEPTGSA